MRFKAYMISQEDGKVVSRFTDTNEDQLDPGEVTIRVAYSSVNYKDALAATGAGRIIRRFPCIGGIDLAGTVVASRDPNFSEGDAVLGTGHEVGVAHHGGYAELARLPADWVLNLPAGMTLKGAMELGTAGFAAALAVVRMEAVGLRPAKGPVIVTGATGGVGSVAIGVLSRLGYTVVALTGKDGAPRSISPSPNHSTAPRGPAPWTTWAAAPPTDLRPGRIGVSRRRIPRGICALRLTSDLPISRHLLHHSSFFAQRFALERGSDRIEVPPAIVKQP